jgi:hypothetical protein
MFLDTPCSNELLSVARKFRASRMTSNIGNLYSRGRPINGTLTAELRSIQVFLSLWSQFRRRVKLVQLVTVL